MLRPRQLAGKRRRLGPVTRFTLSDAHRAWIVENAVRGADRATMADTLVSGGVPRRLALSEIDAILRSPAFPGCRALHQRAEKLELVTRLLREAGQQSAHSGAIERRRTVTAEEMMERYVSASRPVVLTGILDGWPALGWTPELLAERFGDVEVEVVVGRDGDPQPERNLDKYRRKMTMAEYVARVRELGRSNDLYMVANNRVLERPELRPLLDDLRPPPDIFDDKVPVGTASLWFGPAGTFTPLHHDTTNILFCQMFGKKRIDLVSPLATSLLEGANGFYAAVHAGDLSTEAHEDARVLRVELSAGEALFLPAGWWHEVTALETSIHISLLAFRDQRTYTWYRPGRP